MAHGFDLFQGYAMQRPALVTGQTVATSALAYVQLAVTLLAEELDLEEIEEVLRREPALVVQVLQMASIGNRHGLRRQVRSVHEALVLMGTRKIRQWIALTILSGQPSHSPDGLGTALVRARMAEVLARGRGWENPEFAFTSALLSALDLMLGVPLAELADSIDLDESLKTAAFRQAGDRRRAGRRGDAATRSPRRRPRAGQAAAGDLDDAAAEAFAWAMPYVNGLVNPATQPRRVTAGSAAPAAPRSRAGIGRPRCQPCTRSQPSSRRTNSVPASSTPSATIRRPSAWVRSTVDRTIAVARSSVTMSTAERPVELDLVDRQLEEVLQAAVPGAVVVDREPDAELGERLHHPLRLRRVAHHRGLGDLDGQRRRRHLVREQRRRDDLSTSRSSRRSEAETFTEIRQVGAAVPPATRGR